jgi:glycine cleavage system regulatory protein
MSKKSFVDILVGVDGQTSAQNIYQELNQSLDQILKPIMVSLELDPTSITNIKQSIESLTRDFEIRIANIQPTQVKKDSQTETPVAGIDLSEQFADPANMERITKFLKEQNIQFKGMQIAI